MPIVQRPLAAVIARGDGPVHRPRDLEGHTVGVTGLPSDEAVVDSEVSADGGDPAEVDEVTIGFNAVSSLAAGKVDAATGFWNAEGVALRRQGVPIRVFKVEPLRRPALPRAGPGHLRQTLAEHDPHLVESMVAATAAGYAFAEHAPRTRPWTTCSRPTPASTAPNSAAQLEVLLPDLHPAPVRPGRAARMGALGPRARPAGTAAGRRARPSGCRPRTERAADSASAGSSRAMRERGTTRSTPAASRRFLRLDVDVRVIAEDRRSRSRPAPRRRRHRGRRRPGRRPSRSACCERGSERHLVAGRRQHRLDLAAEQQVGGDREDASH